MTCRGSYEIIFLSFLIVLCHLQAKTYFYFNMNLHHEDERNACSKNHINIAVFYPLFNAKNRRSLCLLVLPVGILLMSPYRVLIDNLRLSGFHIVVYLLILTMP